MKQIDKSNNVFELDEFQKDKYKFNIIFKILKSSTAKIMSDEENYIIARGTLGYPTWIWTRDNITYDKVLEIEELLKLYLTDSDKDKFTCKKELYDCFLSDNLEYLNKEDYFEMGTLCCRNVKKPRETDGRIDRIREDELGIIAEYWFNSCHEMQDIDLEPITMERAKEDAKEMFDSGNLYVWRNALGKIVCMATFDVSDNQAAVRHVYTPVEDRGCAYAANLIYEITKIILEQGLVPLLYTDYNYVASNKAYKNVGYEDTGILINFTCSKKKVRKIKR